MTLLEQFRAVGEQVAGTVTLTPGRVLVAALLAVVTTVFFGFWMYAAVWVGGSLVMVNPLLGLAVFVGLAVLPVVLAGLLFVGKLTGGGEG